MFIYATNPVKKVVGEAEVVEVLEKDKEELWNETKLQSGISKHFYSKYYEKLSDYGVHTAPQSFVYVATE